MARKVLQRSLNKGLQETRPFQKEGVTEQRPWGMSVPRLVSEQQDASETGYSRRRIREAYAGGQYSHWTGAKQWGSRYSSKVELVRGWTRGVREGMP